MHVMCDRASECIHMQTMVYPYMQRMREGVHRDLERQLRKRKNAEELQQQLQLQETLRDRDMSRQERWTQWHTASSVIDCGRSWRFAWSSFTCTSLYYEQCRAIPAVHSSNLTPYLPEWKPVHSRDELRSRHWEICIMILIHFMPVDS